MLALLLLVGLFTYLIYFYSKLRKLPPGPFPLPLIGNFPQIGYEIFKGKTFIEVLRTWQKNYRDVYTLWIGPMATVNICDYQKSQEAMVKKGSTFTDRPYLFLMWIFREGRGVLGSSGQHWLEQRRFALHTLRNFGLGRNLMEERIMMEVDYRCSILSRDVENAGGKLTLNFAHHLDVTVGNIINRLLFSERFTEETEKEFFDVKAVMDRSMEEGSLLDFFMETWNIKYPPFKSRYESIVADIQLFINFLQKQVDGRKAEIAAGKRDLKGEPEDYVDAFLMRIQKNDDPENFNEGVLLVTVLDLWFAGQETTSTTLYWAFAYLTLNPTVISKAQAELDRITGRNRALSLTDKPNSPYLNAIIAEVLRVSSIVLFNLWRTTAEDTQVGEYMIEKGTAITSQLSLIMTDPEKFKNPYEFDPDRFMDNNLEQYSTPFGMGKRACLGESLARAELYLILGNLLLNYNFVADPKNPPSMQGHKEMTNLRRARPYQVTISKRA